MVPMLEPAAELVSNADAVLVIGSSMQVYPAASLVGYAKPGAYLYYIDPNPAINYELSRLKNLKVLPERATTGVRKAIEDLMENWLRNT
jgi:NAD-dependent deacetylase